MLGAKSIGPYSETLTFFYSRGKLVSKSNASVANQTIDVLYYGDARTYQSTYEYHKRYQTDSAGNFDVRDSFSYYSGDYSSLTMTVMGAQDSAGKSDTLGYLIINLAAAKSFEIPGHSSGCYEGRTTTLKVYTFPDTTFQIK